MTFWMLLSCTAGEGDSGETAPWMVSENAGEDEDFHGHPRALLADCQAELSRADERLWRWTYDERGHLVEIEQRAEHSWEPYAIRTVELDEAGRPVSELEEYEAYSQLTTTTYEGDSWRVATQEFDAGGAVETRTWSWSDEGWTWTDGDESWVGELDQGLRNKRARMIDEDGRVLRTQVWLWEHGRAQRHNVDGDEGHIYSYDEDGRLLQDFERSETLDFEWECP